MRQARCRVMAGKQMCPRIADEQSPTVTGVIFRCPVSHQFSVSNEEISWSPEGQVIERQVKPPYGTAPYAPPPRSTPPPPTPPPPTGPKAEVHTEESGKPDRFVKFMASDEGITLFDHMKRAALGALRAGRKRFSVRAWVDSTENLVRVNNAFSPWFADELVTAHPELLPIVERRVRTRTGPEGTVST